MTATLLLTPHVTLEELTHSATAQRLDIDNAPPAFVLVQLKQLAAMLELVRVELGSVPVLISSGYRCVALNKVVGGAWNSAHQFGRAVDFTAPQFGTPFEICHQLEQTDLPFDQLIVESSKSKNWVHLAIANERSIPRHQTLTIDRHGTRAGLWAS